MIDDKSLVYEEALAFAAEKHHGQVDKGGNPYIDHCVSVSGMVPKRLEIPALLHDVLEDTATTYVELRAVSGTWCADLVRVLTRLEEETYMQYIKRVSQNPEATIIKLADLRNNMDLTRIPVLSKRDFDHLKRYHRAYSYLAEFGVEGGDGDA